MQAETQETQFLFLDWKDPLEEEMTTRCSILAWLGKSHGQRSLAGYSPWGCKELDVTEQLLFTSLLSIVRDLRKNQWTQLSDC